MAWHFGGFSPGLCSAHSLLSLLIWISNIDADPTDEMKRYGELVQSRLESIALASSTIRSQFIRILSSVILSDRGGHVISNDFIMILFKSFLHEQLTDADYKSIEWVIN